VHVISSYPCPSNSLPVASLHVVPIVFSWLSRIPNARPDSSLLAHLWNGSASKVTLAIRNWLAPLEVYRHIQDVRELIRSIQPDLVHAMRIPFEGILAALAIHKAPLLISVWGNDFTLYAQHNPPISILTRRAMRRADALHCDCFRDLQLAHAWGFDDSKPSVVVPGAGGVQSSIFYPRPANDATVTIADIPSNAPVVINPRGFRGYVRNDTFFRAIPLVLQHRPDVVFLCSAMLNNPIAEQWIRWLNIGNSVRLLPVVPREQMADFFRVAHVTVSPSVHDGTPNTLLEAMACGCFPVAGDIESIREWIADGVNGLLCDPTGPESIAQAILRALNDVELRHKAREYNLRLIAERADYDKVMLQAEQFYYQVVDHALLKRKKG